MYEAMAIVNSRPLIVEHVNDTVRPETLTPNPYINNEIHNYFAAIWSVSAKGPLSTEKMEESSISGE